MRTELRKIAVLIAVCAALGLVMPSRGEEPSREYKVKAGFIVNLLQFVEWPAEVFPADDTPIVVGVLGENPFGDILERAAQGSMVGHRVVHIAYFDHPSPDLGTCQVLFVCQSERDRLNEVIKYVDNKSILTIGEMEAFPWAGGVIRFYIDDNKVRFEVNLDASEKARLKISSKLLKLAKIFKK